MPKASYSYYFDLGANSVCTGQTTRYLTESEGSTAQLFVYHANVLSAVARLVPVLIEAIKNTLLNSISKDPLTSTSGFHINLHNTQL